MVLVASWLKAVLVVQVVLVLVLLVRPALMAAQVALVARHLLAVAWAEMVAVAAMRLAPLPVVKVESVVPVVLQALLVPLALSLETV